jgi:magnesium chelatase family protein
MAGRRPDPDTAFPFYGELSLAHGGILFLDELPEFGKGALDRVVEALKTGKVVHGTRTGNVSYPARFKLVAAMNPCPCGYGVGHPTRPCTCSSDGVRRYKARVKELLDLMNVVDLRVGVDKEQGA